MTESLTSRRILLICAEPAERNALQQYLTKHHIRFSLAESLKAAQTAIALRQPDLIVLAGSQIESRDVCDFASSIDKEYGIAILALLTDIQVQVVQQLAETENIYIVEYPLKLREIRESIMDALDSLDDQTV